MKEFLQKIVENKFFINFIMIVIIFNGISMGLETSKEYAIEYTNVFSIINFLVITIFTVEVLMKLFVYKTKFFKNAWNVFDFFIVLISIIPTTGGLDVLRVLRILRVLRLVSMIPQMRKIVMALVGIIPGMAVIAGLSAILFYVFAVMGTDLYSETFPQWFGSISETIFTLFQIMTLEGWAMNIVRPIMEIHPYAWTYFIPFILIATFIMINLIIAIVVEAMQEITKDDAKIEDVKAGTAEVHELREEILELKKLVNKIHDKL